MQSRAMELEERLFFVGAGAISSAMIAGLVGTGVVAPGRITAAGRHAHSRVADLVAAHGINPSVDKLAGIAAADVVVIAVKPLDVPAALAELGGALTSRHLLISVAAGVPTVTIEAALPARVPVVRAMPNTSALVHQSATAIAPGRWASPAHVALARRLFHAVGTVTEVPEAWLDAVTGLAGSGPAYIYYVAEALFAAGLAEGLDAGTTRALVLQTLVGAATMLATTGEHPTKLRQQVTSPAGTTMAGIAVLDAAGVRDSIVAAVSAATRRARELGGTQATTNTMVNSMRAGVRRD